MVPRLLLIALASPYATAQQSPALDRPDGRNISLSLLQIQRTANATTDAVRAEQLCQQEAAAGADLIVLPAGFLQSSIAGWCDQRFGFFETLSRTTLSAFIISCHEHANNTHASARLKVAVIQGGSPWLLHLNLEARAGAAIEAALQTPRSSSAVVTTRDGRRVNVGVAVGSAVLNHAMAARSLMLVDNELIVNLVDEVALLAIEILILCLTLQFFV